jgi:hypothetical protein
VRKNGNADSGQIKCVASRTPVDCGPLERSERALENTDARDRH